MNLLQLIGTTEIALIFIFVGLGVYLTFSVLNFPDLTVDGTFTLGAALSALITLHYQTPLLSLVGAFAGGFLMGSVTALLHVRFKILPLMAGIIVMTALYSINLRVMQGPNTNIMGLESIFQPFKTHELGKLMCLLLLATLTFMVLKYFLNTQIGLRLRATGDNLACAKNQGTPVNRLIILGVGLSNGLVALGGALFLQAHGFGDISMGIGTIIKALAAITIGRAFMVPHTIFRALLSVCLGTLAYRLLVTGALNAQFLGLTSSDLNLITACFVAGAFIYKHTRGKETHHAHH